MDIPMWLEPYIQDTCKCGWPIINNEQLTYRACSNISCPYHLAERADSVLKYFGVKGVGSATLLKLILSKKYTSHLDVLKDYLDDKPIVHLSEVAKLAMIYGHDKGFAQYCDAYSSFAEMFDNEPNLPDFIIEHRWLLEDAEKYFKVRPPLKGKVVTVMMTGEINGYPARNMFIDDMNDAFGEYFNIKDVGRRKTGVDFLIAEEGTPYHSKMAIAEERGIPIVTPQEFMKILLHEIGGDVYDSVFTSEDETAGV